MTAGADGVWAIGTDRGHGGVYRIDPRRNRVTTFIPLPPVPIWIEVAHGRVWVTDSESGVGPGVFLRIDPRTNRLSGRAIGVGGVMSPVTLVGANPGLIIPGMIVAGPGALLLGNGNGDEIRVNPATGVVTRSLANISGWVSPGGQAQPGYLWVAHLAARSSAWIPGQTASSAGWRRQPVPHRVMLPPARTGCGRSASDSITSSTSPWSPGTSKPTHLKGSCLNNSKAPTPLSPQR
jgi:hypothetical protein